MFTKHKKEFTKIRILPVLAVSFFFFIAAIYSPKLLDSNVNDIYAGSNTYKNNIKKYQKFLNLPNFANVNGKIDTGTMVSGIFRGKLLPKKHVKPRQYYDDTFTIKSIQKKIKAYYGRTVSKKSILKDFPAKNITIAAKGNNISVLWNTSMTTMSYSYKVKSYTVVNKRIKINASLKIQKAGGEEPNIYDITVYIKNKKSSKYKYNFVKYGSIQQL